MKQAWSKSLVFSIFFLISNFVFSQDTIRYTGPAFKTGNEFVLDTIRDAHIDNVLDLLLIYPYVHFGDLTSQGFITEGKKISIIQLSNLSSSLAEKNARAIFSKQPGIFIYDMDAAGNQLNVSTRGLDPHRGWEFNIRHDGILTNSDIYGYPASQSSLARINRSNSEIVDRVEVFINGIELGNGYYELTNAQEQSARFDREITCRQERKLPTVVKDKHLIAALEEGLPECSGMAIGLDRLLMLLTSNETIDDVLNFPLSRA